MKLLTTAGIFKAMEALTEDFKELSKDEQLQRWVHIQKYNITTKELMIAAENKLKPKYAQVPFWSPQLKLNGQALSYYNERVREDAEYMDLGVNVRRPTSLPPDASITTTEELIAKQFECKNAWRGSLADGERLRKAYLIEKAEKAMHERNTTLASALKQIINSETSRALHQRQGAGMKGAHPGSLKSILVPCPDFSAASDDPKKYCEAWSTLTEDKIINNLFRTLNLKKLTMALGSDFAPGGVLYNLVGENGCSNIADTMLDGTFDRSSLRIHNRSDIETLMAFVKHMERPPKADGSPLPDREWTYGAEEYCKSFSKKSEDTSCGPSGLHMSHWIAACEDPQLSALHASFIDAAFRIGQPYPRWETSYHAMIQKKSKPWANAMRIIQLLEGDYNAGLRYLIQRLGVGYAESNDVYSGCTYGGRKGKNTHQVLARAKFTNEYCRLARTPAAIADVDAKNCFDCMTQAGIGYFQRRQGSPKDLALAQCTTLAQTKHYIKTGRGVSKECIQRTEQVAPQGSGQGGGASVGNWQSHNDPMILTFQDLCHPCTLTDPDRIDKFLQWMVSFVDDNKLFMNFDPAVAVQ